MKNFERLFFWCSDSNTSSKSGKALEFGRRCCKFKPRLDQYSVSAKRSLKFDLSWTKHCDVIVKKANRRLYAIRKLKGARVKENDLVAVYCSLIRSILEYGSVAFAHLPNYLSNTLEGIQKRALSIIYPESSYDVALKRSNLTTLVSRRADACRRFIESIQPNNPLYSIIKHNCAVRVDKPYNLRHKSEAKVPYNTFRFRNFVTYKYS